MATYRHTVIETERPSDRIAVGVEVRETTGEWEVEVYQSHGLVYVGSRDIPDLIAALREHGAECERRNGTATKPTLEFTHDGGVGWEAWSSGRKWRFFIDEDGMFRLGLVTPNYDEDIEFPTYAEAVAWCNAREAELIAAAKEQPVQE